MAGVLLSGFALANTMTLTESYTFGDGDSKVSAREIAIENIKKRAADQAGSYVEHDKNLSADGELSQKIRILTAAMVKVTPTTERIKVSSSGAVSIEVTATVSIDDNELKKRVAAIQSDAKKDQTISDLQNANQSLHTKLESVYRDLHSKSLGLADIAALLQQQFDIKREIEGNENAVRQVFEQGALLRIAVASSDRSATLKQQFTKDYVSTWARLSAKLQPSIFSVQQISSNYEVVVAVRDIPNKYESINHLIGTSVTTDTRNKWTTVWDIRDNSDLFKRSFVDKASIIDALPVTLRVSILNTSYAVPYFGIGIEYFMGDKIKASKLSSDEFRSAVLANGYTKQVIGFFEENSHDDRFWIKNGVYYVKFIMSEDQAAKANSVKAQFLVGGE